MTDMHFYPPSALKCINNDINTCINPIQQRLIYQSVHELRGYMPILELQRRLSTFRTDGAITSEIKGVLDINEKS